MNTEKERKIKEKEEDNSISFSSVNGISTFVGYLMPKLSQQKNSNGTI